MRSLVIVIVVFVALATPIQARATGPTLKWKIPTAEAGNVSRWQVCLDGACTDVTPTPTAEGATTSYAYTFPAPLSPQAHTFRSRSCNALACVDSDELRVDLPPTPSELSLK